jgi:YD repeat-containing protein
MTLNRPFSVKITHKEWLNLLTGLFLCTMVAGCEPEQVSSDRKVKSITERECNPCLWGRNIFKRRARTQYFDILGRLRREEWHTPPRLYPKFRLLAFHNVTEYHYDRRNQLSHGRNYILQENLPYEDQDTVDHFVDVYTYAYSPGGQLLHEHWNAGKRPSQLTTYHYDALGRTIKEVTTRVGRTGTRRDSTLFTHDDCSRVTSRTFIGDKGTKYIEVYHYPTPALEIVSRRHEDGYIFEQEKRYLNARGQVLADTLFSRNSVEDSVYKVKAIGQYTYDDDGRLHEYHSHYYHIAACGNDIPTGWHTKFIEYDYEYYD